MCSIFVALLLASCAGDSGSSFAILADADGDGMAFSVDPDDDDPCSPDVTVAACTASLVRTIRDLENRIAAIEQLEKSLDVAGKTYEFVEMEVGLSTADRGGAVFPRVSLFQSRPTAVFRPDGTIDWSAIENKAVLDIESADISRIFYDTFVDGSSQNWSWTQSGNVVTVTNNGGPSDFLVASDGQTMVGSFATGAIGGAEERYQVIMMVGVQVANP